MPVNIYKALLRACKWVVGVLCYVLLCLVALYLFFVISSSVFGLAVIIGSNVSIDAILGYFEAIVALFYVYLVYHTIYK